jgi:NADH-quinone oxidoreductase subunit M
MTVFVGAFQHADLFHRVATIVVTTSIVVTAVYILRVVGVLLLGPIKDEHFLHLKDAKWFERLSTIALLLMIAAIGLAPLWLSNMIQNSLVPIIQKLSIVSGI